MSDQTLVKYISYTIIFFLVASCARTKDNVSKLDIAESDEKFERTYTYDINLSSSLTKMKGDIVFVLNHIKIEEKINEVLLKSGFHLCLTEKSYSEKRQGICDLKGGKADYHFSFLVGWDDETYTDELMEKGIKSGFFEGSGGLLPVTLTSKIEMNVHVTSKNNKEKDYHYMRTIRYLAWLPTHLAALAKDGGNNVYIDSDKCTNKIEKMVGEFIRDFYMDWSSN